MNLTHESMGTLPNAEWLDAASVAACRETNPEVMLACARCWKELGLTTELRLVNGIPECKTHGRFYCEERP